MTKYICLLILYITACLACDLFCHILFSLLDPVAVSLCSVVCYILVLRCVLKPVTY